MLMHLRMNTYTFLGLILLFTDSYTNPHVLLFAYTTKLMDIKESCYGVIIFILISIYSYTKLMNFFLLILYLSVVVLITRYNEWVRMNILRVGIHFSDWNYLRLCFNLSRSQYVDLLRNHCPSIGCGSFVNNEYTYSCISNCLILHVWQSVSLLERRIYT